MATPPKFDLLSLPALSALTSRLLSFADDFRGFPNADTSDEALILAARQELGPTPDAVGLMTSLAAQFAETEGQYECAKSFVAAYVESTWDEAMFDWDNAVYLS